MRVILMLNLLFCFALQASSINSATAFASAKIVIMPAPLTKQVRSLQFDGGESNTPVTVSANDESAAVLQVTGVDEYVFRVHLPENVYMKNENQLDASAKVKVHSFTTSNSTEATCPDSLHIGATRDPLPLVQNTPSYRGAFLVTIIY